MNLVVKIMLWHNARANKSVFLPLTSSRSVWTLRFERLLGRFADTIEGETIRCVCGASHPTGIDDPTLPKWLDDHGLHMPALPYEPPEAGNLVEQDDAGDVVSMRPARRWPDGRVEVVEQALDESPPDSSGGDLGRDEREVCHDCGVKEGQLHLENCDMERCPHCGGQIISCECAYRHFYPDSARDFSLSRNRFTAADREHGRSCEVPNWACVECAAIERKGTGGLPAPVYFQGLSGEQQAEWDRLLAEKGRVPWIHYPWTCCRCGRVNPEMFSVPDEEWDRYVEPAQRDNILCRRCFDWIKDVVDEAGSAS